ncbi:MAG: lysophospholipid acyltransferase family protein [Sediminispirochaetaceae bacterium]
MKFHIRAITLLVKGFLSLFCKVDDRELAKVPKTGPFLVVVNHINFLEVPLLYTYLYPRSQTSLVKIETWRNPFLGPIAKMWDAIPINRSISDFSALKAAIAALRKGKFLIIAPEGTRSGDGKLRKGKQGVALLAVQGDVPIFPLVHYGGEGVWSNLKRGRRTHFTFKVGPAFRIKLSKRELTSPKRRAVTDEVMSVIASTLPQAYRGYYEDKIPSKYRYLDFGEPLESK